MLRHISTHSKSISSLLGRVLLCLCVLSASFANPVLAASEIMGVHGLYGEISASHHPHKIGTESTQAVIHKTSKNTGHCEGADCGFTDPCAEACSVQMTCCSATAGIHISATDVHTRPRQTSLAQPDLVLSAASIRLKPDLRPPI